MTQYVCGWILTHVLSRIQVNAKVVIVGGNEYSRDSPSGSSYALIGIARVNRWVAEVVGQYPNVTVVNIRQFVLNEAEVNDNPTHFSRMVYYRLFEHLHALVTAPRVEPMPFALAETA